MFARGLIRPLIFAVGSLVAGLLLLGAAALLVNLSWFDATLHPELERLEKVEPLLLEENAYPIALGFIAADGLDPRAAGEKILQALHERFLRGEPITLDTEEMNDFLGGTAKRDVWRTRFKSLDCNARVDLDCADRVIAEVTPLDTKDARLGVLLNRYESMIRRAHRVSQRELGSRAIRRSRARPEWANFPCDAPGGIGAEAGTRRCSRGFIFALAQSLHWRPHGIRSRIPHDWLRVPAHGISSAGFSRQMQYRDRGETKLKVQGAAG